MILSYNNTLKEKAKFLRRNSSKAEIILWKGLKSKQLLGLQFNRQKMVDNYIIDFYCKKLKLAIEIDDRSHDMKYDYDAERTQKLNSFGIRVLRFSNGEVIKNAEGILESIKQYIQQTLPSVPSEGREE